MFMLSFFYFFLANFLLCVNQQTGERLLCHQQLNSCASEKLANARIRVAWLCIYRHILPTVEMTHHDGDAKHGWLIRTADH